MFHVNPQTGDASTCRAEKGKCPFGTADEHFTSASEARAFYEGRNEAFKAGGVLSTTAEIFESAKAFAAYRSSESYVAGELSVASFGMEVEDIFSYGMAKNNDSAWDSFEIEDVVVADYQIKTSQEKVFSEGVAHYIAKPLEPSEGGLATEDAIVVNAVLDEENNTIHVLDGNHRCAAALLSGKAIPMRLMPLEFSLEDEDDDWLV